MAARRLWTPAGQAVITGDGYDPHGRVLRAGRTLQPATDLDITELLTAAVLCNDAALHPPAGGQGWTAIGDPTEAALLAAAARFGLPWACSSPGYICLSSRNCCTPSRSLPSTWPWSSRPPPSVMPRYGLIASCSAASEPATR
jgi:cation transport ATPase-like protein